jgi:hypothetical protein
VTAASLSKLEQLLTEIEAKQFVRISLMIGPAVYASPINLHSPKRIVPTGGISRWLEGEENNAEAPIVSLVTRPPSCCGGRQM